MNYKKNQLYIENIPINKLTKKFGSPLYCYSFNKLKANIQKFKENFKSFNPLICFSIKSNSNLLILKLIKNFGLGVDVVSQGELMMALKAGINPKKIVFSGVGKTLTELKYAINKNILLINAESESEILKIEKIAKYKRKKINIGIRLNPDIDAKTIQKISTGKSENKFGLTSLNFLKTVNKFKNSPNLVIKCLSVHIGSQITSHVPYENMLNSINRIIKKSQHKFDFVDLGGGMGISYNNTTKKLNYKKYNILINKFLKKNKAKIIFEPGRSIIGNTALLLTKILYIKKTNRINFVILDAAMNDLMRPALYGAKHKIIPARKNKKLNKIKHEFVGPICETSDTFLSLPKFQYLNEDDILAICDVGAYGMVLSSNYNLRAKPAEVMINKSSIKIINKRQRLSSII
tara:strand:+ start:1533 stop:2747 length:1215 start_codon:yes stop_codon:yes gene_type:complete